MSEQSTETAEFRGRTEFHSETGTEGGYWAVQRGGTVHSRDDLVDGKCPWDESGCPVVRGWWHEHATYEGLHILRSGDHLTVYDGDGETLRWSGEISLIRHPLFTESAGGLWIHADQAGVNRDEWAGLFFEELPCLVRPSAFSTPSGKRGNDD